MKSHVRSLLVVIAAVVGAAAQQQPTAQSEIFNSGEPISIASQSQLFASVPGTLKKNPPRKRAEINQLVQQINEHNHEQIERRNRELTARFNALQQAGGWQQAFLSQLAQTRLELPNSTEQLNLAQQFLQNFVLCGRPLIAEQVSEFSTNLSFPSNKLDKEFVVEPLASIIVSGCGFGPQAGEARLILSQDPNNPIPLQVSNWSDTSIFATLAAHPGIPDQDAQLVIVRSDGSQSVPMPVQFFQHRVAQVFNVAGNLRAVQVFTSAHTTQDQFRFVTFNDGSSEIAASHYTFCCSAVNGVDTWLFTLKNNWQIPNSQVFRVTGFDTALPTSPLAFVHFTVNDGISDCGIFSSGEGFTGDTSVVNTLVSAPGASELNIPWHAGSNCSGLVYFVQVVIWGPDGLPFD